MAATTRKHQAGDGDFCPQDADGHGRMYLMHATQTQWCPHSAHKGSQRYEYDGVTPFTPRPAAAARGRKKAAHGDRD